jgi:hypothetical protein
MHPDDVCSKACSNGEQQNRECIEASLKCDVLSYVGIHCYTVALHVLHSLCMRIYKYSESTM